MGLTMSRLPIWMGLVTTGIATSLKSLLASLKILVGILLIPITPLAPPLRPETREILTKADVSKSKSSQQVRLPESVNFHFTRCCRSALISHQMLQVPYVLASEEGFELKLSKFLPSSLWTLKQQTNKQTKKLFSGYNVMHFVVKST